jgi:hypothetical protein
VLKIKKDGSESRGKENNKSKQQGQKKTQRRRSAAGQDQTGHRKQNEKKS